MISVILDRLWEGASAGLWSDEEALDAIADLNPESSLGKVLTDVMAKVSSLKLFDPLLGYTRHEGLIKVFFSNQAAKTALDELVLDVNDDYRKQQTDNAPPVTARLLLLDNPTAKEPGEKMWVMELRYVENDGEPLPVDVDLDGELDADGKQPEANEEPESEEDSDEAAEQEQLAASTVIRGAALTEARLRGAAKYARHSKLDDIDRLMADFHPVSLSRGEIEAYRDMVYAGEMRPLAATKELLRGTPDEHSQGAFNQLLAYFERIAPKTESIDDHIVTMPEIQKAIDEVIASTATHIERRLGKYSAVYMSKSIYKFTDDQSIRLYWMHPSTLRSGPIGDIRFPKPYDKVKIAMAAQNLIRAADRAWADESAAQAAYYSQPHVQAGMMRYASAGPVYGRARAARSGLREASRGPESRLNEDATDDQVRKLQGQQADSDQKKSWAYQQTIKDRATAIAKTILPEKWRFYTMDVPEHFVTSGLGGRTDYFYEDRHWEYGADFDFAARMKELHYELVRAGHPGFYQKDGVTVEFYKGRMIVRVPIIARRVWPKAWRERGENPWESTMIGKPPLNEGRTNPNGDKRKIEIGDFVLWLGPKAWRRHGNHPTAEKRAGTVVDLEDDGWLVVELRGSHGITSVDPKMVVKDYGPIKKDEWAAHEPLEIGPEEAEQYIPANVQEQADKDVAEMVEVIREKMQ